MPKGIYKRTKAMKDKRRQAFFDNPNYKRFRHSKENITRKQNDRKTN